ncbi:MAG: hypothetical protein ABW148_09250 [Sedimenticola sp.]
MQVGDEVYMKVGMLSKKVALSLLLSTGVIGTTPVLAEYPTAGLTPDKRPQEAPVISEVNHNQAWKKSALKGIDKPYPGSLSFLDDQGNWYTPFTRPGMVGPYDIRGLHQ